MIQAAATNFCSQAPSTSKAMPSEAFDLHETMASASQSAAMRNVVAIALIHRLHEWCVKLFWITILCVIRVVGDESQHCSVAQMREKQRRTPRKSKPLSASSPSSTPRSKTHDIAEIEMKLLRHLTSPQLTAVRPLPTRKRHAVASRPPSPQLFDIHEEPEDSL